MFLQVKSYTKFYLQDEFHLHMTQPRCRPYLSLIPTISNVRPCFYSYFTKIIMNESNLVMNHILQIIPPIGTLPAPWDENFTSS